MLQSVTLSPFRRVSAKGGISLQHGMWYDLRNGIIIGKVIYAFCKDTLSSSIYFFESFCIYYIPHNYAIPQVMPRAIPEIHSSLLPSPLSSYPTHYFIATVCNLNTSPTTILEACFGWFRPLIRLKSWESPFSSFWS